MSRPKAIQWLIVLAFVLPIVDIAAKERVVTTRIATASNFFATLNIIIREHPSLSSSFSLYPNSSKLEVVPASTGKLSSQINQGAPFDIFLSADTIGQTLKPNYALASTEFTYAFGQLALASRKTLPPSLSSVTDIPCIAIANAKLAPYGKAAEQVLEQLKAQGVSIGKVIRGQSVMQAWQFFDSGACDHALVAYSLIRSSGKDVEHIIAAQSMHQPIRQNAVLLSKGESNPDALNFMELLKSETAKDIIRNAGYLTELP